jgi:pimeloyl-ACP methyl ester carboxylesterase
MRQAEGFPDLAGAHGKRMSASTAGPRSRFSAAKERSVVKNPEVAKFEIEGAEMVVRLMGDRETPALLLIHGFPSSSAFFRNVIGPLARDCFVIAPDLPGFGGSEPVQRPSFSRFADMIEVLLEQLGAESFHLYLHDYGAAVGLHLATRTPRRIRSLIVQNANAHESGMGQQWSATRAYWGDPTPEWEAEATAHLTFTGSRQQYVDGLAHDIAERIDSRLWEEDWRIMSLPGRLETQRALVLDSAVTSRGSGRSRIISIARSPSR